MRERDRRDHQRAPGPGWLRGGAVLLAGIFGVGLNLRGFIAGLPPLFREFHNVLGLSPVDLAIVGAIPVLCFAVFAVPAAPLSRRFGEERVLGAAPLADAAPRGDQVPDRVADRGVLRAAEHVLLRVPVLAPHAAA